MRKCIKKCGFPISTTSANISGESAFTEIKEIIKEFGEKVDVIIDGGKSKIGVPSTIVEIENNEVKILRQGSLEIRC